MYTGLQGHLTGGLKGQYLNEGLQARYLKRGFQGTFSRRLKGGTLRRGPSESLQAGTLRLPQEELFFFPSEHET